MRIAAENLESCINGIFVAAGSRVEEARVLAEHLIGANLCQWRSKKGPLGGCGLVPTSAV